MRAFALIAALVLGGCTINVIDERLTREEVEEAFGQRDAVIEDLMGFIKKLDERIEATK